VVTTLVATHFLGPKRKTSDKLETFEAGIKSVGNARQPFSIKYFVVAILFVLFDVEVIFMYPWAVNFRTLRMDGNDRNVHFHGYIIVRLYLRHQEKSFRLELVSWQLIVLGLKTVN
jgi:NADH-quinone oxidoreductase subunit A